MKLLFMHNTIPEYRIEFMKNLAKLIETDFLISNKLLQKKIYDMDISEFISDLNINYIESKKRIASIKNAIIKSSCDTIILPPVDNVTEYINAVIALVFGKIYKKKMIYWCEKWEADKNKQPIIKKIKNSIHRVMIKSIVKNCNICIASGSKSKEYLLKLCVEEKKIKIAYDSSTSPKCKNKIDLREKYGFSKQSKIILYLGRVVKRKGAHLLIKAFDNICDKLEDTYLLICGEGDYLEECKYIANKLNNEKIVFAGKIDFKMRSEYYLQSNIFVLPSYSLGGTIEAWGLTVNEAMELGLPVIATKAVGAAHDLINYKNGVIIDENDILELSKAILKMTVNKNKMQTRKECMLTYEKFSIENMVNSFRDAIINE